MDSRRCIFDGLCLFLGERLLGRSHGRRISPLHYFPFLYGGDGNGWHGLVSPSNVLFNGRAHDGTFVHSLWHSILSRVLHCACADGTHWGDRGIAGYSSGWHSLGIGHVGSGASRRQCVIPMELFE